VSGLLFYDATQLARMSSDRAYPSGASAYGESSAAVKIVTERKTTLLQIANDVADKRQLGWQRDYTCAAAAPCHGLMMLLQRFLLVEMPSVGHIF